MDFPHSQYNVLELEDKVTVFCRPNSVTTSGQLRQIVKSCTSIQLCLYNCLTMYELGLCLGWYGHLMALYKAKSNWVTWSPPKYVLPIIFS